MISIMLPSVVLGALGVVFGLGLAFASKVFEIKEDERIAQIREILPGVNCAACGYSGCDGYAAAIARGEAAPTQCPVGGKELAVQIGGIMGVEVGDMERKVARVECGGNEKVCKKIYRYDGIMDCAAAEQLHGGHFACSYGCLGYGNCVRACGFGAIFIEDGIARVISSKCTACGKCAKVCPKKLIELIPVESLYTVRCDNKDKGSDVRKVCSVGCIGCGRCVKVCAYGAIELDGHIAHIDPCKCANCGECVKVCTPNSIGYFDCAIAKAGAQMALKG